MRSLRHVLGEASDGRHGCAVRATREESHALATVLREDDVVDHTPIRRGQLLPLSGSLLALAYSFGIQCAAQRLTVPK